MKAKAETLIFCHSENVEELEEFTVEELVTEFITKDRIYKELT